MCGISTTIVRLGSTGLWLEVLFRSVRAVGKVSMNMHASRSPCAGTFRRECHHQRQANLGIDSKLNPETWIYASVKSYS